MTKRRIPEQKDRLTWPEWRLYANFLHRELARLWYGKKSIFTLIKGDAENAEFWKRFGFIWYATIRRFGVTHGIAAEEIDRRIESLAKKLDKIDFIPLFYSFYWFVRELLGNKLAREFLFDFQITEIIMLAVGAGAYAMHGKMPPYTEGADIHRLEFYEGLPVDPQLEELFYGKNPLRKS